MNHSSIPQNDQKDDQNSGIVPASNNLQQHTHKGLSPEMMRLGMDGSRVLFKIAAEYQALRDIEETKRQEIEVHYRERMEIHNSELNTLVEQMRKQSKDQNDYINYVFALANRMLDEGFPELSVHVYELFINDSKRKNIMEYFIEYHERITLGKIKLQKNFTDTI